MILSTYAKKNWKRFFLNIASVHASKRVNSRLLIPQIEKIQNKWGKKLWNLTFFSFPYLFIFFPPRRGKTCKTPIPFEELETFEKSKIQSDKRGAARENNCKTIFDRAGSYNTTARMPLRELQECFSKMNAITSWSYAC